MHFQLEGRSFTDILRETALYDDEHDSLTKAQDCLGEGYTEEMHLRLLRGELGFTGINNLELGPETPERQEAWRSEVAEMFAGMVLFHNKGTHQGLNVVWATSEAGPMWTRPLGRYWRTQDANKGEWTGSLSLNHGRRRYHLSAQELNSHDICAATLGAEAGTYNLWYKCKTPPYFARAMIPPPEKVDFGALPLYGWAADEGFTFWRPDLGFNPRLGRLDRFLNPKAVSDPVNSDGGLSEVRALIEKRKPERIEVQGPSGTWSFAKEPLFASQRTEGAGWRDYKCAWTPVSAPNIKMLNDNPYHSDYLASVKLNGEFFIKDWSDWYQVTTRPQIQELHDAAYEAGSTAKFAILAGPAYGEVMGRVVKAKPNQRVQSNEIALLPNAGPDYTEAALSALASVTPYGGMLSHLAVVGIERPFTLIRTNFPLVEGDRVVIDLEAKTIRLP